MEPHELGLGPPFQHGEGRQSAGQPLLLLRSRKLRQREQLGWQLLLLTAQILLLKALTAESVQASPNA